MGSLPVKWVTIRNSSRAVTAYVILDNKGSNHAAGSEIEKMVKICPNSLSAELFIAIKHFKHLCFQTRLEMYLQGFIFFLTYEKSKKS
jgi:hypothetical protein